MVFTLTDDQQTVIKTFLTFLTNPSEKYMVINGPAGTGKTTIIKAMLKAIDNQYALLKTLLCQNNKTEDLKITLAATTNKAVAVLKELSNSEDIRTVHSTLGLALSPNYHTGEIDTVRTRNWHTIENTVLIIDESSMLANNVFEHIQETLVGKSKVVFIGDTFQLAPVKSRKSKNPEPPKSVLQDLIGKVPTATLSKVLRHDGMILNAATAFRKVVETKKFTDIVLSDDVVHLSGADFKTKVDSYFKTTEYQQSVVKMLAWSNKRVQGYNDHIRKIKGLPIQFQSGEVVITNKSLMLRGCSKPVDSEVKITRIVGKNVDQGIPGRDVIINGNAMAFLPDDYTETKKVLQRIARKAKSPEYENKTTERKNLWSKYFEIKDNWLDLRSPYASTVHKAQGSSYDTVFIDLYDIGCCNVPADVARMLYVAISRAKKKVYLTGDLPSKYKGKL